MTSEPEEIFRVLLKVFGDGDTLPQLQQKFFSYRQGPKEDLLTCSLELVELFTWMAKLDESCKATKGKTLKGRLAEAVRDEGLQRELRRLNMEAPELSFFDVRDRAIEWLGRRHPPKEATVQGIEASNDAGGLQALLKKQSELIEKQQQQIDSLLKVVAQRQGNQGPSQQGISRGIAPTSSVAVALPPNRSNRTCSTQTPNSSPLINQTP